MPGFQLRGRGACGTHADIAHANVWFDAPEIGMTVVFMHTNKAAYHMLYLEARCVARVLFLVVFFFRFFFSACLFLLPDFLMAGKLKLIFFSM